MTNIEFNKDLVKRTREFATRILELSASLPDTIEEKVIRSQLTMSGTSIGATYREAIRQNNKADYFNKIKICESESSDTIYWLEMITLMEWVKVSDVENLLQEANELLTLFNSMGFDSNPKTSTYMNSNIEVRNSQ